MKRVVIGLTMAFSGAILGAVNSPGWAMQAPQGDIVAFALGALMCLIGAGVAMMGATDY